MTKKFIIPIALIIFIVVCVIAFKKSIIHVQLPHGATLHILSVWQCNGARGAVVICPGGGYSYLEKWREGYWWFPFFYFHGYTPALLEYRMPKHNYHRPITDGTEAIQMMRKYAKELNYDVNNVGIVGFSAGGHLASTIMVVDNDLVRPDFGILFYPVISMKKELTHIDSHNQLLGENASEKLENQFSNELHISDKTPPTFIAVTSDDKAVSPLNSVLFYKGMMTKNRPVSFHIYPIGGHGWVVHPSSEYHKPVLNELSNWLSEKVKNSSCSKKVNDIFP